jgi:uncharacterized membrane protein YgcG
MRPATIAATVFSLVASVAWAQAPADSQSTARWAPWLGCWQLIDESMDDGNAMVARMLGLPAPRTNANAGALVCVTPASSGVTMTTFVNDQSVLTETVVADGSQQPLSEPDCRGWQRAEWSALGARLFATAEIACAGQPARAVSGMAMMTAGPQWIDVQMIESQGRKNLRVRRYERSANQRHAASAAAVQTAASMPLGLRLSIPDVKEASTRVAPEVLQAALIELGGGFDLNGRRLVELDEAGVADGVVDLMVALSFPKRFVVERRSPNGGGWATAMAGFDPMWYGQMWPYVIHPYFYTSYYAPFGYRYWGYYDQGYFAGPGFVTVNPDSGQGIQPTGEGRVVDGLGYTRIRRNTPDPAERRSFGDGSGGSATQSAGSSNGGSSSGSSGVSSSGYSGGGGGGARTAQPRPPGN